MLSLADMWKQKRKTSLTSKWICILIEKENQNLVYFSKALIFALAYQSWPITDFLNSIKDNRKKLFFVDEICLYVANAEYGFLTSFDLHHWYFWLWTCETDLTFWIMSPDFWFGSEHLLPFPHRHNFFFTFMFWCWLFG